MTPRWVEYALLGFLLLIGLWYLWLRDYTRAWYWLSATSVTAACVFGMKH